MGVLDAAVHVLALLVEELAEVLLPLVVGHQPVGGRNLAILITTNT